MADVLEQEIAPGALLTLLGKPYHLTFPLKAVIAYKQKTGDNLFDIKSWANINPKTHPENFATALWAALISKQPNVTLDEVECMIDFSNAIDVENAIVSALASYFPKGKPAKKGTDPKAPAQSK